jgi:cytochrome c peroxidase
LRFHAVALAGLALVASGSAAPLHGETRPATASLEYTYALGTFAPEYTVPEPGSYSLPVIQRIADHRLLDSNGRETSLFALKGKRAAVVAFIYTSCAEATGCPYSTAVLHRLDTEVGSDPNLAPRVSLVTISFDPDRDTPQRLATIRALHRPKSDWRFATTSNEAELAPLLADFDQPAVKLRFPDGRWSGRIRHVLKVFLLDEENCVRNVYSVGFLNPELLLADLRTLLGTKAG